MIIVPGGVTSPKGFVAHGCAAGIKKSGNKDLAVIVSEVPAVAAGAFTANRFQASPVKVSRKHLAHQAHQAIIVNSGNANCANGARGDRDARMMAKLAADALGLRAAEVLVASTGIIGRFLPIENVRRTMPALVRGLSARGGHTFSETIMTTDTVAKEFAVKCKIGSTVVTIGGACKGVGMIYPDVVTDRHATMLVFITTDAAISKKMLEAALDVTVPDTFNMVSVDGDMSTNDSCFIMANGLAGNKPITRTDAHFKVFTQALHLVMAELAKKMARDGEGATKFVEIKVTGAPSATAARTIARKISTSMLFKSCVFGNDPNWGRIIAAAGASGIAFKPERLDLYLGDVKVFAHGMRLAQYDVARTEKIFRQKDIAITLNLHQGTGTAIAWTCDLTKEYVAINAEYST